MTAPDRTTWHVAEDADGDETLWYGDIAILRQFELESHGLCRSELPIDLLWQVLTRVLAPDEATIDRLARTVAEYDGHNWDTAHPDEQDAYVEHVNVTLAALAMAEGTRLTIGPGRYRNHLGAEIEVVRPYGYLRGERDELATVGDVWVAQRSDDLFGRTMLLVTREGLEESGYELADTSAQARHTDDDAKDDCPSYSEMTGGGEDG